MLVDFEDLYQRYSQDVYRFTLYLSGDPSLAEEITQESFVRAWVTPGEISGGTVKAYLLTIARNLYLAEGRRVSRQVTFNASVHDSTSTSNAPATGRLDLEGVLAAVQLLPESDRVVLLMHAQEGLTHAAIASVLGLSITAVKVRVHRARMRLRQLCQPNGE